ncbi:MAG: carboxymuconolactone decarboxylase family protein [Phycisphaerae bacterium]|nr:carboxymuconolactone decarboxylase family protein [Phycisphaerales bacterium]
MSRDVATFFEQWETNQREMKESTPDVMRGFGGMFQALMKEGALSVREKELIAFSIGLAVRCEQCMNLHIDKCLKAGATREQIIEAAGVVVVMQGGPAYTHMPEVIHALDYLEGKK